MKLKESTNPSPFGLKSITFSEIPDDRFPKRPRTAPILWAMERMANVASDARVGTLMDCMREFKNLPEAEQKVREYSQARNFRFPKERADSKLF